MARRYAVGRALALACALGMTRAPGAEAPKTPAGTPIPARSLTNAEFDKLPPTAVIEIDGRKHSVAELRAVAARHAAERRARLETLRERAKASLEAVRAKFRDAERARVESANARLRPGFLVPGGKPAFPGAVLPSAGPAALGSGQPSISSVQGTVEPGALLHVRGHNLGAGPGTVLLRGLPGGDHTLPLDKGTPNAWSPGIIAVVVPDIEKVVDQPASLVVVTKDGASTAPSPVSFHAALVVEPAVPIRVVKCGKDATENGCVAFDFFEGVHTEETLWERDGSDCDEFRAVAKEPWTFDHFAIEDMSHGGSLGNPRAVREGDAYGWQMCWSVKGAGWFSGNEAGYLGYFFIKGPQGVPAQ